jgi:hypothetical protein
MIKLKKISEAALPKYRAANWDNFIAGADNGDVSLPIAYELTGTIIGGLEIGKSLSINRDTRNGVVCQGIFYSTTIKDITEKEFYKIIETENSVYLLEDLG